MFTPSPQNDRPAAVQLIVSQQRMRPAIGTLCAIEASGPAQSVCHGIDAAFAAISYVEKYMHPTRSGSDLTRLNNSRGARVEISAATWDVLATAHHLYRLSEGVFDPCLPSHPGCLHDLELLPDSSAICHAPLALDLGGIAKGYAIDQAIHALQQAGCNKGMVNAGGDLRIFGESSQEILIRTQQPGVTRITLKNAALAVSEMFPTNRPLEHQGYYQKKADKIHAREQVAVVAEQAMIADALTKCAMFCTDAILANMLAVLNAKCVTLA